MKHRVNLAIVLLAVTLVVPLGCRTAFSGGTAVPTDDASGLGGDGGNTDGSNAGDGGTSDGGTSDGGTVDDGTDGGDTNGGDTGGGEPPPSGEADTDGLDGDTDGGGVAPPTVTLFVDNTNPAPQQFIILSCLVGNDGGGPVTSFSFSSSAGSGEIQQDGSSTATALVPVGLWSITYTCNATNQAGTGPDSPPIMVYVTGG